MAVGPAVRVGIIIVVALMALAAVAWFLTGYRIRISGYPVAAVFDDALGLTKGSEVRMAGVAIGVVDNISLNRDQRAVVRMLINRRYRIPEGSEFTLRVGLLIGEKYVDIVPNREAREYMQPGARVEGKVPPRFEDLLLPAQELVARLNETAEGLRDLLADEDLRTRLHSSFENIERATAKLDQTMAALQGIVTGEEDEIRAVVSNVALASENLRELTGDLARFAEEGGLQENVSEASASVRRTAESLERTTASLEQLVTAPQFQEDIRETAAEARQAVKEAHEVVGRIGRIFGMGPRLPRKIPTRETNLEAVFRPHDDRFRATLSTTISLKDDSFLRLGLYDIGAGNKFILQPGQTIDSRTDFRYGIYASRLGLGLDYALSSKWFSSLNLYDSYDPRLDVEAGYNVTDDWGVLLGVDRLFDDNELTLGVRLTK